MSGREHDGPHEPQPAEHHELEPEYVIDELDGTHAEHEEPVSVSRAESDDWLIESSTDSAVTNYRVPPRRAPLDAIARPAEAAANVPPVAPRSVPPRPRAGNPFLSPQHFTTQPLGTTAPLPNDRAPRASGSFVIPEQRRSRPAAADGGEEARQRVATPLPAVAAVRGHEAGARRGSSPPPPPLPSQPSIEARHSAVPPAPSPARPQNVANHPQHESAGYQADSSARDREPPPHAIDSREATSEPADVRPRALPRSAVGHTRLLITPPPARTEPVAPSVAASAPAAEAARATAAPCDAERATLEAARAHAMFAFARALADWPDHGTPSPSTDAGLATVEAAQSESIDAAARAPVNVADGAEVVPCSDAQPQRPLVVEPEVDHPSDALWIAAEADVVQHSNAQPQRPITIEAEGVERPAVQPQRPITVEAEGVERPAVQPERAAGGNAEAAPRASVPPPRAASGEPERSAAATSAPPRVPPPRAASGEPERSAAATSAPLRVPPAAGADIGGASVPPPPPAGTDGARISTPPPPPAGTDGARISTPPPPPVTTGAAARARAPGRGNDDANSAFLRAQLQQALARARSSELRLAQAELRARRAELTAQQLSEAQQSSRESGERMLPQASPRRWRFQFLIWCVVCFAIGGYVSLLVPIRNQMLKQDAALRELNQRESLAVEAERKRCESEQERLDSEKAELAERLQQLQQLPMGKAPPPLRR